MLYYWFSRLLLFVLIIWDVYRVEIAVFQCRLLLLSSIAVG